ncbi:MAG: leucyl aminopeptidase [Alphaproteobacteria bacterium]|nr:leucyl aminopeptidase [Alphaproteobacteria bacterium]
MDVTFSTSTPTTVAADLLVVGVAAGQTASLDQHLGAYGTQLAAWLAGRSFDGKAGSSVVVPSLGNVAATQVAVVGLGAGKKADLAKAAGKAGLLARGEKATSVALAFGALDAATAQHVLEFVAVGNYAYDRFQAVDDRTPAIATLQVLGAASSPALEAARDAAAIRARYQGLARDLVNAPAAVIYPESLADEARQLATLPGVTVEVWDLARCKAEGLVGIEAVGQGSTRPGVLIHVSYRPVAAKEHIALVGKGVTFDSGGLSLKPSAAMQTMRCDMGGAATALATVGAVAALGVPVAMDVFVPSVENMNDGNSYKLGDILTYRNGVSVEIHNTDAEGRLILADALLLASEVPGVSRIVDMATLTGAIVVALGPDYTGLFTKDDALAVELSTASDAVAEKMWRMPLDDAYLRMLKGTWGKIKNVGGRDAGSTTAALYLQHFVRKDVRWAHLDIAGTAFLDTPVDPYVAGGTGQVVRALVTWVEGLAKA